MDEALAHPGKIIRKLRGTTAEQVEALGVDAAKENAKRPAKSKAKPSRAALDRAEREVQEIKQRQDDEMRVLKAELASLQKKVDLAERTHAQQLKTAERRVEDEAGLYEQALSS
jgi:hypothetical protein